MSSPKEKAPGLDNQSTEAPNDFSGADFTSPKINTAIAKGFLRVLDPTTEAFTFQTFDDNKERKAERKALSAKLKAEGRKAEADQALKDPLAEIIHGTLEVCVGRLNRIAELGGGVYVMLNQGDGSGRNNSSLVRMRAVWQDDDAGFEGTYPVDPHIVMETSPGKYQRVWLCDGLTQEEHRAVMERMIADFGNDKNAKDLARVFRLAGSWHQKDSKNPHQVVLVVSMDRPPYTRDEILAAFPPMQWKAKSKTPSRKDASGKDQFGGPDLSINDTLGRVRGPVNIEELKDALSALPIEWVTDQGNYSSWLEDVLMGIHEDVLDDELALEICDAFSRGAYHGLDQPPAIYGGVEEIEAKLNSFTRGQGGNGREPRTTASIFKAARDRGWLPGVKPALAYFDGAKDKQAADAGFAFEPESLDRLAALEKNDPAGFARVFEELSKGGAGKRELKKRIAQRRQANAPKCDGIDGYSIRKDGVYRQQGDFEIRLTNFDARIVEEIYVDDGIEKQHYYRIEGRVLPEGTPLEILTIPVSDFQRGADWVSQWGTQAVVEAGNGVKDHLRVAIQKLSRNDVVVRHQYGHTGWREIDGQLCFLFSGGAISGEGFIKDVEVSLDGSLKHYRLPDPAVDVGQMRKAIGRSLNLMDLAPRNPLIGALLVSAAYTAPLGHWVDLDCSVHSFGQSGVFKTEASGLLMQHYGTNFNGRVLPSSWNYSLARLMGEASRAKDVVLVIDDYKIQSSEQSTRQISEKANRVFTNVGNRLSEGRARQDGSSRPDRVPMCLPYSSGEIVPDGESCRARIMLSKVGRGEIDHDRLTKAQGWGADGAFALAMAGYIRWLATDDNGQRAKAIRARLREELRSDPDVGAAHARSPDNAALMLTGLTMVIDFATEMGVVNHDQRENLLGSARRRLLSGSIEQAQLVAERNEAVQFMRYLREGIDAGRMRLDSMDLSLVAGPDATKIGWRDGSDLLLTGEAFTETRKFARELGDPIIANDSTLKRRLYEKGFLRVPPSARNKGEWVSRKKIGKTEQRGFHLVVDWDADLESDEESA